MREDNIYHCDKCEEPIYHNEQSFEVRYGFICLSCNEEF